MSIRPTVKRPKIDYILALCVFILVLFGLVMISSASVVTSFEKFGSNFHYLNQQLVSLGIGIVVWLIATNIDYRFYQKHSIWFLIISILLLVVVFIPGIGASFGGAKRWIHFGPVPFQPSEVVKLTFIIYLACWLDKQGKEITSFIKGFLPFILLVLFICGLIVIQPDMGTMSIIFLTAVVMYFTAGASWSHLSLTVIFTGILGAILIRFESYRMARFLTFFSPEKATLTANYHILQAMLAIGSGGLWGLGFGQSRQKYLYLPQAHSDSIFAIIAEELGFIRAGLVVALFVFIGMRGFAIAKNAPDRFSQLLSVGLTSWILIQVFINLFAMLGIIPLTGVPLPFISAGGSSLVVTLAAVGILLNISKHIQHAR